MPQGYPPGGPAYAMPVPTPESMRIKSQATLVMVLGIVATVLSCCGVMASWTAILNIAAGVAPIVLGSIAMQSAHVDPLGSATKVKIGWIMLAVWAALLVAGILLVALLGIAYIGMIATMSA